MQSLGRLVVGGRIPDLVATFGTLNYIGGEVER